MLGQLSPCRFVFQCLVHHDLGYGSVNLPRSWSSTPKKVTEEPILKISSHIEDVPEACGLVGSRHKISKQEAAVGRGEMARVESFSSIFREAFAVGAVEITLAIG